MMAFWRDFGSIAWMALQKKTIPLVAFFLLLHICKYAWINDSELIPPRRRFCLLYQSPRFVVFPSALVSC